VATSNTYNNSSLRIKINKRTVMITINRTFRTINIILTTKSPNIISIINKTSFKRAMIWVIIIDRVANRDNMINRQGATLPMVITSSISRMVGKTINPTLIKIIKCNIQINTRITIIIMHNKTKTLPPFLTVEEVES